MQELIEKLNYTARSINNLQLALEEKGIDMTGLPLMEYGDKVKTLSTVEVQQCTSIGYLVKKKRAYEINNDITTAPFSIVNMEKFYIKKLGYEISHLEATISNTFNEIEEV